MARFFPVYLTKMEIGAEAEQCLMLIEALLIALIDSALFSHSYIECFPEIDRKGFCDTDPSINYIMHLTIFDRKSLN